MRRFTYRLAVKLGYVNVDYMLRCISLKQFYEWLAFSVLEPFDEERADVRAAGIAHAIVNAWRKRGKKPYPLKDFQVVFGDKQRVKTKKTWQQMKSAAVSIVEAFKK